MLVFHYTMSESDWNFVRVHLNYAGLLQPDIDFFKNPVAFLRFGVLNLAPLFARNKPNKGSLTTYWGPSWNNGRPKNFIYGFWTRNLGMPYLLRHQIKHLRWSSTILSERLWMFLRESVDDQCTVINIVGSNVSQRHPTTANVSKYVKSASSGFIYALWPVWLIWSCSKNYASFRRS